MEMDGLKSLNILFFSGYKMFSAHLAEKCKGAAAVQGSMKQLECFGIGALCERWRRSSHAQLVHFS